MHLRNNTWNGLETPIIEGSVYVVEQFLVKDVVGTLKAVQSDLCIIFTTYTTVKAIDDDSMISTYKFQFLDLGDLFAEANKYQPQQQPEFAIGLSNIVVNPFQFFPI